MSFQELSKLRPQIKTKFWATLGHEGQTLDDLIAKMEELGNHVLEVDEVNNRILVAQSDQEGEEVWGCPMCLRKGALIICDNEDELRDHYRIEHGREF